MTDTHGLATIATLYQASNAIYELFDKVLVLDEGKQIYYGPVQYAKPFMEYLGFVCEDGANVADFLTGVTVPTERQVKLSCENTFPQNADAVKAEYERSPIFPQMLAEYEYPCSKDALSNTYLFQRSLSGGGSFSSRFSVQVWACIIRQYQIVWGDRASFLLRQCFTVAMALIGGSLFYNATDDSSGLFIKTGAMFFSLLFNSLLSMTEISESFGGRPTLLKHKGFALHHPAAVCIAQITADIPLVLFQISIFSIILYFMVGLTMTAGSFFTFWIILISATMVSIF